MVTRNPSPSEFIARVADRSPLAAALSRAAADEQQKRGYFHTFREICQQPELWRDTAARCAAANGTLRKAMQGAQSLALTGSGSSEFVGESVRAGLGYDLGIDVATVGSGTVLLYGGAALPASRPAVMVSIARSGDSPESAGALDLILATQPDVRHLVITCNAEGSLAADYNHDARVSKVVLDGRTNDESLVMTSSFTNLALASRSLAYLDRPESFQSIGSQLAACGEALLEGWFEALARTAHGRFSRAVYLGSGERFGAARESALKMLEMTAGRVAAFAETYLGLRHGPMSFLRDDSLIVCFLSSDPLLRAYECDLIDELNRKKLGWRKVLVGENIPAAICQSGDVVVSLSGMDELGDANTAILHVVVGQILGLFRCLQEGLKPDSPSEAGVINRVVGSFTLHRQPAESSSR